MVWLLAGLLAAGEDPPPVLPPEYQEHLRAAEADLPEEVRRLIAGWDEVARLRYLIIAPELKEDPDQLPPGSTLEQVMLPDDLAWTAAWPAADRRRLALAMQRMIKDSVTVPEEVLSLYPGLRTTVLRRSPKMILFPPSMLQNAMECWIHQALDTVGLSCPWLKVPGWHPDELDRQALTAVFRWFDASQALDDAAPGQEMPVDETTGALWAAFQERYAAPGIPEVPATGPVPGSAPAGPDQAPATDPPDPGPKPVVPTGEPGSHPAPPGASVPSLRTQVDAEELALLRSAYRLELEKNPQRSSAEVVAAYLRYLDAYPDSPFRAEIAGIIACHHSTHRRHGVERDLPTTVRWLSEAHAIYGNRFSDDHDIDWATLANYNASGTLDCKIGYYRWLLHLQRSGTGEDVFPVRDLGTVLDRGKPVRLSREERNNIMAWFKKVNLPMTLDAARENIVGALARRPDDLRAIMTAFPGDRIAAMAAEKLGPAQAGRLTTQTQDFTPPVPIERQVATAPVPAPPPRDRFRMVKVPEPAGPTVGQGTTAWWPWILIGLGGVLILVMVVQRRLSHR